LPNSSSSRASQAFALVRKTSRSPAGDSPGSDVEITRGEPAGLQHGSDLDLDLLSRLAGLSPGETGHERAQLPAGLWKRVLEAPVLFGMEVLRVADDDAALGTEHDPSRLEGRQPGKTCGADGAVAILFDSEQGWVV
jgi:hypothetical protein